MKVTLLAPHQITKGEPIPLYGGLGILVLASSVIKNSYDCEVLDLVNYHTLINSDMNCITDEIVKMIFETNPNILGMSTMSDSLVIALELCKKVKAINPDICIVLGGPGVSYCAEDLIHLFPQIDYIIRGEADYAFPEFINAFKNRKPIHEIKGIVYQESGKIFDSGWPDPVENLDDLPIPAYEFCNEDVDTFWFDKNFGFHIEAGRGCPYNCIFCSTSNYFKRKYRVKSPQRLVKEIKYIQNKLKGRRVRLTHDLLTFKEKYINELCDEILNNFENIRWGCDSRVDTISSSMIAKMKKAGCDFLYFGIETGTKKMQKVIGKKLNLEQIDSLIDNLKENKINFVFSFVLGVPGEDISDIKSSLLIAIKAKEKCLDKCMIQMHPLMLELGSKMFEDNKNNLIYNFDHSCMETALPDNWDEMRDIIKLHPNIFSRFFSLNISKGSGVVHDILFISKMIYIIEEALGNSLIFAYRILKENLVEIIIESLVYISNNQGNDREFEKESNCIELICTKIHEKLKFEDLNGKIFESISNFEVSAYEIKRTKTTSDAKILNMYFSPDEIKKIIVKRNYIPEIFEIPKKLMIVWDEKNHNVVCLNIPLELMNLTN